MKKLIAVAMTVLMSGLLLAGCGSSSSAGGANEPGKANKEPEKGAVQQKIVIGLDDTFAPMGFRDDGGNLVGFDLDMAKEVASRLDMDVEFKPIDWNSKEVELNSKKIDMIWNGLTITAERLEKIAFSKPYMANRQIIVVLSGSDIKTKADLAGKVVATQEGSSSVDALNAEPEVTGTFKELRTYADFVAVLNELAIGRADAVVGDEPVLKYYMNKKPGTFVAIEDDFGEEEFGVGLRKDDTELLSKLQGALDAMKADGKSAEISKKWFGEDIVK
ncbi:amino acid ABC transporter substrate-binding protein, PAAT family [Desulfitobacterium dehalogenans ATCC 51507]|uniref:Amino acid ABC transporter substrate-binding protein, PAAT family n=1 Tax=Desulfitobacterium dehalogenans (strain ATCC 51507 / DSM 9161 / JW/IU-DC1) TaxID=756499 RepID=I4ADY8_DESDJ|nr:amino acid ABC transporter substrate-binding protein [Desulfitobacterium dehalogenans]AFM02173.1 amino acid ABC transporter substrate-binding protein, PAAT family [Desulfitobacterium dehalogenans ATCC 51507]